MECHRVEMYASKAELPEEQKLSVLEQNSQEPTRPPTQSIPQISTLNDVYKCHICNVNIPKTHKTEHNNSFKHKTHLRIANEALERIRDNMNEESNCLIVNMENATHFCDSCDTVMQITDKEKHEQSDSHEFSVICGKLLSVLYTNKDTGTNKSEARDKEISMLATELVTIHFIKYLNDTIWKNNYKSEADISDTLKNTNKCGTSSTSVQQEANDDNSYNNLLVSKANDTDIYGENNKDATLAQNMACKFETGASLTQNAVNNKTDITPVQNAADNVADNIKSTDSIYDISGNVSNNKIVALTQDTAIIVTDNNKDAIPIQNKIIRNEDEEDKKQDAAQNKFCNITNNKNADSSQTIVGNISNKNDIARGNTKDAIPTQNSAVKETDNKIDAAPGQSTHSGIAYNNRAASIKNPAGIVDSRETSAPVQIAADNVADVIKGATSTESITRDTINKSAALSQNTDINIYKCKLCNVSVPNNAHNIDEHNGGVRHKNVLELVLKSPVVRKLGSAFHCRLCDFLFSESNIETHLTDKHEAEVLKMRSKMTNTKATRECSKREITPIIEQDEYIQCCVCNKSIINKDDMIKLHENEDRHKIMYQNMLTANRIKTYNNTEYCEACRVSLSRQDVDSHVSSLIHRFNMKSVDLPKDITIQYECKNNEMICKVCKVVVDANLKPLESHIQGVNHLRNVSLLANGIEDIMEKNYVFPNGDNKPSRSTVPTKPAFLGRKMVIAFRRRISEKNSAV